MTVGQGLEVLPWFLWPRPSDSTGLGLQTAQGAQPVHGLLSVHSQGGTL